MPNTWDGRDAAAATLAWVAGSLKAAARSGFSTIFDASGLQVGCVMFVLADSEGDYGPGDDFVTGAFGVDTKVDIVGVQGPFTGVPFDSGGKKVLVVQGYDASGALAKVDFSIRVGRSVPEQGAGLVPLPVGPVVPFPVPPTLSTPPDQVLWKGGGGGDVTTWNDVLTALGAIKTNLLVEVDSSSAPCAIPAAPPPSSACQGRLYFQPPRYLAGAGGFSEITVDPAAGPIANIAGITGPCKMRLFPGTVGVPALQFTPGNQTPILRLMEGGQLENNGAQPAILMVNGDQLIIGCGEGGSIIANGVGPVVHLDNGASLTFDSILGGNMFGPAITGAAGAVLTIITDGSVDFSNIAAQLPGFLGTINVLPLFGTTFTTAQAPGGLTPLVVNPPAGWTYFDKTKGRPQWWDGPQGGPGELVGAGVTLNFYSETKLTPNNSELIAPGYFTATLFYPGGQGGGGIYVGSPQRISRATYAFVGSGNPGDAGTTLGFAVFVNGVAIAASTVVFGDASADHAGSIDFPTTLLGNTAVPDKVQVFVIPSAPLVGNIGGIAATVS